MNCVNMLFLLLHFSVYTMFILHLIWSVTYSQLREGGGELYLEDLLSLRLPPPHLLKMGKYQAALSA